MITEPKNVKIVNIHENKRFPGLIYAELRETDGTPVISATLGYVLSALDDINRQYNCINARKDKFGNWVIN